MKISFLMLDKLLWIIALWSFFVIGISYPHLPKCNAFCLYQLIWGQLLQNVLLPGMQCFLLWSNVALSLPNSITPPPPAPSCYPSQWGQLVRGMLHQCYVFLFLFFSFSFLLCFVCPLFHLTQVAFLKTAVLWSGGPSPQPPAAIILPPQTYSGPPRAAHSPLPFHSPFHHIHPHPAPAQQGM